MATCPFFKESMWSGNKCQASGDGDGAPVQERYIKYCGYQVLSDDYHQCPLYKDATGKRDSGCYLTSACMCAMQEEFDDNCYELGLLRQFRDSYVKDNYPQDIKEYYRIAPLIVEKIQDNKYSNTILTKIYKELVIKCCNLIEEKKLYEAYNLYKSYSINLAKTYLN